MGVVRKVEDVKLWAELRDGDTPMAEVKIETLDMLRDSARGATVRFGPSSFHMDKACTVDRLVIRTESHDLLSSPLDRTLTVGAGDFVETNQVSLQWDGNAEIYEAFKSALTFTDDDEPDEPEPEGPPMRLREPDRKPRRRSMR